jgi:hypothetical protein
MNNDDGHELKGLPILRGMRRRYQVWRRKKSLRPPIGSVGHGAKEPDREHQSGDEIEDQE